MIQKIFFILLCSTAIFAQKNDSLSNQKAVKFKETFSIYYVNPIQIGNHTLAKDYKNRFGFGATLTIVSIKNFNLGFGGEYISYGVTDKSNAGNFSKANYKNAFFLVNYPIQIAPKFQITPSGSVGFLVFTQREKSFRYSNQNGTNYRLGLSVAYEISKNVDAFFGVDYIYTKFKLNANPEIIDYYGKSNNLQISIGIKLKSPK